VITNNSISFIIPTRNRSEFIDPLIKRCLEIENSIIIISDNSDKKIIDKIIQKYNSDRIIYNYYSDKLSVIDNFNFALNFVKTSHVCYLGDDDIIGPGFEEAFRIQIENHIDVLNVYNINRPLQYFWPNNPSAHWGDLGGMTFFGNFGGGFIKNSIIESRNKALSKLGEGPLGLPRVYLGIISIELINNIKSKYGDLFGGYSPDIYSSLLISQECKNPYYIDYPIIIPGACSKSTSSARASRSDVGGLLDNDHLSRFEKIVWDKKIPEFYSPYNIWASTALIALKMVNIELSIHKVTHIYALNLLNSRHESRKILDSMKYLSDACQINLLRIYISTFSNIINLFFIKLANYLKLFFIRRPGASKFVIKNNTTSYDAYVSLKDFLSRKKIDVKKPCF
jgi:glycosyltransferase involved in cell wall biosynthesis